MVNAIAIRNNVPTEEIKSALIERLDKDLCYRRDYSIDFHKSVKVIAANWEALVKVDF